MRVERTIFHRWAQGRAIVRNASMRRARNAKARLLRAQADPKLAVYFTKRYTFVGADALTLMRDDLVAHVRRARQAHRDWRTYRARHFAVLNANLED